MSKHREISEKERLLRVELAHRTVDMHSNSEKERRDSGDSPELIEIGREISKLISEEHLEQARDRLKKELAERPEELMLINFQMILEVLYGQPGNRKRQMEIGARLMELAVEKNNTYYVMTAIGNMGLVAHNEGYDEFSKVMYLAAHFLDKKAQFVLCNLAGWYARRGKLEQAQQWIDKIIDVDPEWQQDDETVAFFLKDESLYNLRGYEPFKQKVLSKIVKK